MTNDARAAAFSRKIEGFFGGGKCFLLAKGRVGLYAGLKAMSLPQGGTVLMPGYTCMVVPSAVQFAGLKPAYVDIDPLTYNLDVKQVEAASSQDISALIVQHTYGIPCNMAPLMQWATSRGVPIIEDCCHSFGSKIDGRLCGTFGALAFLSGQWNKPFSTGLGGMLLVNDDALAGRVGQIIDKEAFRPGPLKNAVLSAQILAHKILVRPGTAIAVMLLYRALNRLGLVVGSSSQQELQGEMPERYLATMAPCQIRQGLREMARIQENIEHRVRLTAFYQAELPRIGFAALPASVVDGLPLLRYPVRVANKEAVLASAVRSRVEIGSWFEIPLHPAGTRMEAFGYRDGMCPEAEAASREVINLPTHRKVSPAVAERTLEFLRKQARPR
jgi:dTDP-4-amino-4,6-dideoxygalactose transaminase